MKKILVSSMFRAGFAAAALMAAAGAAHATPYASGITNNAGTIQYILNEAATSVSVTLTNLGLGQTTTISGGTVRGVNSFSLTQGGTTYSNYSISVQKNGSGSFAPTGPDFTADIFNGPRGVAVNTSPLDHNFGRIYVVNASPGTATPIPSGDTTRTVGKGVYVVNSDGSDALGYGVVPHPITNGGGVNVEFPAGETWGTSTTYSPYKVYVGPDDQVYVGDATSYASGQTSGGSVWIIDPDLNHPVTLLPYIGGASPNSAVNTGPCSSRPFVTGSLAQSNLTLYCTEYNYIAPDAPGLNYIYQYSITNTSTNTLPYTNAPVTLGGLNSPNGPGLGLGFAGTEGVSVDIFKGPVSGEWYTVTERSTSGSGNNNLTILDTNGNVALFYGNSLNNGGDPWTTGYSVVTSADEKYMAVVLSGGNIVVCAITNNGMGLYLPDYSTCATNATGLGGTARSLCFDAADNIDFITGGDCVMRSYSLGLTATCVTANDYTTTNGTFSLSTPSATVTVVATTNTAYKNQMLSTGSGNNGPSAGEFTIARTGDTSSPLTVTFAISGTASNTIDYSLSPASATSVTIAAGQSSTNITVTPIHTGVAEPTTTVILTVAGSFNYSTTSPLNTATVTISDDSTPAMKLASSTFNTMYEANPYDYSTYTLTRLGNTNAASFTVNIAYSGTAAAGRYSGPTTVTVNPGDATETLKITPINDSILQGNQTIIATVASGSGYTVPGSGISGTNTIVDDEVPTNGTKLLFSDDFSASGTNVTTSNYNALFASTNLAGFPNDYNVMFQYDYSAYGIPPAPHTKDGSTLGVYMTVNKGATGGPAAGLNLYPVLSTFPNATVSAFSNAYRVTFDMFLIMNYDGASTLGTTEYALFGINHSGLDTNWFRNSTGGVGTTAWQYDGLFYDVEADGAALGDYVLYSGPSQTPTPDPTNYAAMNASAETNVFKYPPFTPGAGNGGSPANEYTNTTYSAPCWVTVEIDQIGSNVVMKINNTTIIQYTNTIHQISGDVMLGYDDAYDGVGLTGGGVIYDNLSVSSLGINIANTTYATNKFNFTFGWGIDEPASVFTVQSTTSASLPFTNNANAVITRTAPGAFAVSVTATNSEALFRVQHK